MRRRSGLLIALLSIFVLVAAACGQKADVANVAANQGGGGGGFDDGTGGGGFGDGTDGGGFDDGTGGGGFDDGTGGDTGGSTDGGATGGDTGGGTDGGATGGGDGGAGGAGGGGGGTSGGGGGGGGGPVPAGDRTGITDKEIIIGIHAPVTGAAPIPQTSFDEGKDVYWNFINANGGLFGKNVRIVFEDDQFDPRTAVAKCKKMVTEDKVFMLVGGGGADQITACAQYANSVGVPYLSAGVNEEGLLGIRAYFAVSESYAQQSPQLVQMTKKRFAGKKFGIAVADSGSFNDAYASINKAAKDAGLEIVYNKRIPKSATQNQALGIASEMSSSGAEVIYFLSSPTTFLNVAAQTGTQNYFPQWIGPGLTSGLNTVANIGCQGRGGVDKAIFFSPFPQLDVIDSLDPDFKKQYRAQLNKEPDDLALALWGLNKTIHQMFLKAGETVSRQSFVQTLESGAAFKTNVYPQVQFSAQNHLGAKQVHVLQADCGSRTFKTIGQFVSGF